MAEVMQDNEEQQDAAEPIERKPKRNDRWVCPKCGTGITLHIKTPYPPTCGSSKHSTTGAIVMVLQSEGKKK